MNNKLPLIGVILFITGMLFLLLENTFYQYIDNVGVLHESLFLPLGIFCLLGGLLIAVYCLCRRLIPRLLSACQTHHNEK